MASKRIEADFSEDTVGFALESFLAVLSFPMYRFSIEPFTRSKERWLGADARLYSHVKSFKPFYMQFKKPSAYPDISTSKIIKDRKNLSPQLEVSPRVLFFELRKKEKHHADFQHNILYRWRNRLVRYGKSDAVYVCPLFVNRSAYTYHIHLAALRRWLMPWRTRPWDTRDITIHDQGSKISFSSIPILAEHVSIPPHAIVASANHSYSFSERGQDFCFHSPLSLPETTRTLGEWLTNLSEGFLEGDSAIPIESSMEVLRELLEDEEGDGDLPVPGNLFDGKDGLSAWLDWGEFLKREYSIEQFAFVNWQE